MRLLIVMAVIVLSSAAGYSYATSPRVGSVEDLSFQIALDRDSYPPDEAPLLTLTLTNTRWYPVYIERDFTLGRTVMVSIYRGESRYATRVIPTTLTTKGCAEFMDREVNPYAQFTEVILLEPGESVSAVIDLGGYEWYNTDTIGWWDVEFIDWNIPGSYAVDVLYVQRWCSRVTPFTKFWKWVGRIEFKVGGGG
jgi:hypothetical protein